MNGLRLSWSECTKLPHESGLACSIIHVSWNLPDHHGPLTIMIRISELKLPLEKIAPLERVHEERTSTPHDVLSPNALPFRSSSDAQKLIPERWMSAHEESSERDTSPQSDHAQALPSELIDLIKRSLGLDASDI